MRKSELVIFRLFGAIVLVFAVSGCAGSYRNITSGITGCDKHEIAISNAMYGYNRMWTATCRDRIYTCRCDKGRCGCVPAVNYVPPDKSQCVPSDGF